MKRAVIIACLTGLVLAVGAYAADDSTNAPPAAHHPMRPMMGSLLPPRLLQELALTGDQQSKYDALDAGFKSDLAKLRAENAPSSGTVTNAPAGGGRQAFRALRKSYIDKMRAFLTADQNAKLTEAIENMPGRGRRGAGQGAGTNSPAPASPSESK